MDVSWNNTRSLACPWRPASRALPFTTAASAKAPSLRPGGPAAGPAGTRASRAGPVGQTKGATPAGPAGPAGLFATSSVPRAPAGQGPGVAPAWHCRGASARESLSSGESDRSAPPGLLRWTLRWTLPAGPAACACLDRPSYPPRETIFAPPRDAQRRTRWRHWAVDAPSSPMPRGTVFPIDRRPNNTHTTRPGAPIERASGPNAPKVEARTAEAGAWCNASLQRPEARRPGLGRA